MRLRRPCEHDRYDSHSTYSETVGAALSHYHNCPGGEFLPEDALVIEKVEGLWPEWAIEPIREKLWANPSMILPAAQELAQRALNQMLAADQVGEPG